MKKIIAAIAAVSACLLFAGCAATGAPTAPAVTLTPLQIAALVQAKVTAACNVLTPTIQPLAPLLASKPGFSAFNTDLGNTCAANATLNVTSLTSLINTSIAAAQAQVPNISSLSDTDKLLIVAGLGVFKGALENALASVPAAVPATASGVIVAPAAPTPASGTLVAAS
jgi:hypothetical protein